jgi:hypothetical protein
LTWSCFQNAPEEIAFVNFKWALGPSKRWIEQGCFAAVTQKSASRRPTNAQKAKAANIHHGFYINAKAEHIHYLRRPEGYESIIN